jgi:hypothetical protein
LLARGGEAKRRAGELVARVQDGDVAAQGFAAEILAKHGKGDVARKLAGGPTPAERKAAQEKADAQRHKDEGEWAKRRADEKEKLDKEVKQAEDETQEGADDIAAAERKEGLAKRKAGIELGRDAGEAARKAKADRDATLIPKGLDLGHLPLVPEGATQEQADQIMGGNARKAALDQQKPIMPGDRVPAPGMRPGTYVPRARTKLRPTNQGQRRHVVDIAGAAREVDEARAARQAEAQAKIDKRAKAGPTPEQGSGPSAQNGDTPSDHMERRVALALTGTVQNMGRIAAENGNMMQAIRAANARIGQDLTASDRSASSYGMPA